MKEVNKEKNSNFIFIMVIYLLGIFMGAIDTGIVTPARTVIQSALGVDGNTGIWMITIYTLAYAASIPIMGKLADKYGRKYIYIASISLFGIGSLLCGLSENFDSFTFLLIARVVQAIGGGGILPVATAEFGTTFPKEKRGMALGLVGGVYGIANIIGSSVGSAILDAFGVDNWQFIFFINVPITIFIVISGCLVLPNTKEKDTKQIDFAGIITLTIMVLSLLYGLKNIDFFAFTDTIKNVNVFLFLILFVLLLPVFIFAEKKAQDPVMNLNFFRKKETIITLVISAITGIVMMGMIFIPQFSENALFISSGSGGYFVIILGVFSGISAPLSGKMIDKFGPKPVLSFGFASSMAGSLYLIFVTTRFSNFVNVAICLIFMGIGIGFTMGTPLNYMMLENSKDSEANSAMACVSLVRSLGTAVAPAIMVGFISHAGMAVQGDLMKILPTTVDVPKIEAIEDLKGTLKEYQDNPATAAMLEGMDMPDFSTFEKMDIPMGSSGDSNIQLSDELLKEFENADVTNITDVTKDMAVSMFSYMQPTIEASINDGIDKGINGMQKAMESMGAPASANGDMDKSTGDNSDMKSKSEKNDSTSEVSADDITGMVDSEMSVEEIVAALQKKNVSNENIMKALQDSGMSMSQMMQAGQYLSKNSKGESKMDGNSMQQAQGAMQGIIDKMQLVKKQIPDALEGSKQNYLSSIEEISPELQDAFQQRMNKGFKQVYLTVTIASILALLFLVFYKSPRIIEE